MSNPRDQAPSANQFGKIRSMLARSGVSQSEIRDAIGESPNGRTRSEIADELKNWLRDRPKGGG